jgi:hypothetical protein
VQDIEIPLLQSGSHIDRIENIEFFDSKVSQAPCLGLTAQRCDLRGNLYRRNDIMARLRQAKSGAAAKTRTCARYWYTLLAHVRFRSFPSKGKFSTRVALITACLISPERQSD